MNYYERYCGDYGRDTSHLSLAEHGAYTLLLDVVYSTERPLPASLESLYRICRAMTEEERCAVKSVAEEFFPVGDDGWRRNARAERDILKAAARIKAARENGLRRKADKLDEVVSGIGKPIESQPEPSGIPSGLASGKPVAYPPGTYGESTRPHTPEPKLSKPKTEKPPPVAPLALPDWMPAEWRDFDEMRRAKNGKAWTRRAQEMAIRELSKLRDAGHDPAAVLCQSVIAGYPGLYPPRVASISGRPISLTERRANTIDRVIAQGETHGRVIAGVAERVDRKAVSALPVDLRQSGADDVRGSGCG